jgi:hypothetical protein
MLWMVWILTAVTVFAGIVALMMLILVERTPDLTELGPVSNRWIDEHQQRTGPAHLAGP